MLFNSERRFGMLMLMAPDSDGGADVNEDNYLGTDEEGNSYYADDDGNITMVDSDGNEVHSSVDADRGEITEEGGYTYDTDTENDYTFDESGNLINADTGDAADTSAWGNAIGVEDADGKTVAGYTYDEKTGRYTNGSRSFTNEQLDRTLHNSLGGSAAAVVANNIALSMGNLWNDVAAKNIAVQLNSGNDTLRQALADNADAIKAGQVNTGSPVMVAILTGTMPVNTTQKEAETVAKISDRLSKGESLSSAFYSEMDAAGYTNHAGMNRALVDAALEVALTYGTMGLGLAVKGALNAGRATAQAAKMGRLKNFISNNKRVLNAIKNLDKGMKTTRVGRDVSSVAVWADKLNDLYQAGALTTTVLIDAGLTKDEAQQIMNSLEDGTGGGNYYSNLGAANTERNATKSEPESTPVETEEPTVSRSAPESEPVSTKEETDITFNPTYNLGGIDFSGPFGSGGIPSSSKPKVDEEESGFETESSSDDDSGSDNLESTTPPSSGVGTDTYSNPNVEQGRKGWGLGEEDPNRANYDTDKWNRGMERASTDVVSDAKCKDFITKTFKNDPVLIKTVKIMKGRL